MLVDGHTIEQQLINGKWKAFRDGRPATAGHLKIGSNSIDVTLGDKLLVRESNSFIDPYDPSTAQYREIFPTDADEHDPYFMLMPNTLYLGFVRERFEVREPVAIPVTDGPFKPRYFAYVYAIPMIDGRSTLGRLGVTVHETAGFGDFGFEGCFTLEIATRELTKLYVGMRIAQVSFQLTLGGVVNKLYAGAYSGKDHIGAPVPPRLGRDRF
jgi:dCTP deaminase